MSGTKWNKACIKDVCKSIIDCVNKTAPSVDYQTPYKMIRTTNVRDGWINLETVKYVTEEVYHKWIRRGKPQKGDIILTREAPLGEVGMLRTTDDVFLGQRTMQYKANPEKLDNRFLLYSLMSHDLQAQIKAFGSGATVEHMRVPDAEKLMLPLPVIETQKKIGVILASYDDLIDNNLKRIKILEEMAQMIYREWFVNFRFPGHEKVKMVDSPLGKIPEGWEVENLFEISEVTYGFPFKSKLFTEDKNGNMPVIRIRDILNDKTKTYTPEKALEKYIVRNGDILIGMDGDFHMGRWAGDETYLNQRVVRFRPNEGISAYFLFWALEKPIHFFNSTITGTTVAHLGDKHLRTINIVIPPVSLLEHVCNILDPIFNLEIELKVKNANLRKTRDLLLPKLISGELDVEGLDIKCEEVEQ